MCTQSPITVKVALRIGKNVKKIVSLNGQHWLKSFQRFPFFHSVKLETFARCSLLATPLCVVVGCV